MPTSHSMRRILCSGLLGSLMVFGWAVPAHASQMITWGAHHATLKVNRHGVAVVSWTTSSGARKHTLAWGAINARTPSRSVQQVRFRLDYSGGWGSFGGGYWRRGPV